MTMMSNMLIENCHLTTTDTRTDIAHAIVIAYLLMLIVRITLTSLCSIEHHIVAGSLIWADKCTTTRSSNHLVAIE